MSEELSISRTELVNNVASKALESRLQSIYIKNNDVSNAANSDIYLDSLDFVGMLSLTTVIIAEKEVNKLDHEYLTKIVEVAINAVETFGYYRTSSAHIGKEIFRIIGDLRMQNEDLDKMLIENEFYKTDSESFEIKAGSLTSKFDSLKRIHDRIISADSEPDFDFYESRIDSCLQDVSLALTRLRRPELFDHASIDDIDHGRIASELDGVLNNILIIRKVAELNSDYKEVAADAIERVQGMVDDQKEDGFNIEEYLKYKFNIEERLAYLESDLSMEQIEKTLAASSL